MGRRLLGYPAWRASPRRRSSCCNGPFEIAVRAVVVADEPEAVCADGDRGVAADVARRVDGGDRSRTAGGVVAVGHLEVAVRAVVVADEPPAVRADGDRGTPPDGAGAVERHERRR